MKRVPFRCEAGHITIRKFRRATVSEITCRQSIKNMTMISDGGSRHWMARYIEWPIINDGRKIKRVCNKVAERI